MPTLLGDLAFFNDMGRKKIEKIEPTEVIAPSTLEEPKKILINPFSGDFGREDINKLRDKINEIIDFINQ